MRNSYICSALIATICFAAGQNTNAQKNHAYAITGETKGNAMWMAVKEIDLGSGAEIRSIYSPKDKPAIIDAARGIRLQQSDAAMTVTNQVTTVGRNGIASTMITYADGKKSDVVTAPTESLVAATAFDAKTNRLYYTPMHSNELRYFDLSKGTNMVYYVRNTALKNFQEVGENDVITRMCFGSDGYGYALTNDGNHLIRFSSGDKITVTDLGSVRDGDDNENISIRNMCTSWGGDLVADAFGKLYVISMKKNVFEIDPQTMVADYKGAIANLPEDFMVNGAAVDEKGSVIVSSATKTDHYYTVDLKTLQATALKGQSGDVYNASDLASGHFIDEAAAQVKDNPVATVKGNSVISIFPNPVVNRTMNVAFDGIKGKQNLQLVDAKGNIVYNKVVDVANKSVSTIALPSGITSGIYILKVSDANGRQQYSGKVVVY
ncbi:MAG TPA: T9SS type A sorting domain-containing protein [Panacibacter sp.]|nr:T9SS type A sorting domain-containing protein [Panacibacter sp.]HNP43359.1 T9SS type A sorting domain-containing protein [Panacibacter sp.]